MKSTGGFDDGNPTPAVVDLVVKFVVVALPKKNDGFVIGNLFSVTGISTFAHV